MLRNVEVGASDIFDKFVLGVLEELLTPSVDYGHKYISHRFWLRKLPGDCIPYSEKDRL